MRRRLTNDQRVVVNRGEQFTCGQCGSVSCARREIITARERGCIPCPVCREILHEWYGFVRYRAPVVVMKRQWPRPS